MFAGKETDRAADKSHLHAITLRVAANYSISPPRLYFMSRFLILLFLELHIENLQY